MRVTVIGAGVVGLACAAKLRMRGHDVTMIDPVAPGEHCSLGNAGALSRCSFLPLGMPGMWKKVPGWLLDPDGPLSIRAAYARRALPWVWRLHRASTVESVNAIADALFPLVNATLDRWRPLAEWAGVPELVRQEGYAWVYESEAAFEGDAFGREMRRARGVKMEILTGAAIRAFDRAIAPGVTHMVVYPEQGHCPNPLRLSQALAARLAAAGTRFVKRRATSFEYVDDRIVRVVGEEGIAIDADAVVVAAGAHSNMLSKQLGCPVLLETERGYHVMLEAPSVVPRIPIMSAERKFFATPMEGGLRVAGTVELAGLDAPPNYARTGPLLEGAGHILPGLTYAKAGQWMGHRPSLPDSKPVIGRSPRVPNAIFAFGHGHVGLTCAAPTAEIVADIVGGREPYMDITPFAPDRPAIRWKQ